MQNLAPLVIFRDTAICDGCGLSATIATDGERALGQMENGDALDGFSRRGSLIETACQTVRRNVPCHGYLTWDLATEGWGAATNMDRESLRLGSAVER